MPDDQVSSPPPEPKNVEPATKQRRGAPRQDESHAAGAAGPEKPHADPAIATASQGEAEYAGKPCIKTKRAVGFSLLVNLIGFLIVFVPSLAVPPLPIIEIFIFLPVAAYFALTTRASRCPTCAHRVIFNGRRTRVRCKRCKHELRLYRKLIFDMDGEIGVYLPPHWKALLPTAESDSETPAEAPATPQPDVPQAPNAKAAIDKLPPL